MRIIGNLTAVSAPSSAISRAGNRYYTVEFSIAQQRFDPDTGQPYADPSSILYLRFTTSDNHEAAEISAIPLNTPVTVNFTLRGRAIPAGSDGSPARFFTDINVNSVRPIRRQEAVPAYAAPSLRPEPAPVVPSPAMALNVELPEGSSAVPTGDDDLPF